MSDKKEDSQPSTQQKSDSQPGSSQNAYQTLWQTNEPIDVDAFEPICIKEEMLPIITKVESISDPTNAGSTITKDKAMIDVCKILVLNGNQSLEKIKEDFKKKYSVSGHDPNIDSEKAATCTSIYIGGMPVWFHFLHMEALIQLNSEFNVDCGSYYIDIFKDTENKQSDKCLIRFVNSRDCLQVYKGLHGIVLIDNDKKMVVNLDIGDEIANVRDNYNPKFEEQLRTFNETRTRLMQNSGQVIDGASDISDDPIEIDNLDLKDTENTNEISILVEDDDIDMVDNINDTHKDKEPAESEMSLDKTFRVAQATKCKIVHIMNLDTTKANAYYLTIIGLMNKMIGTVPKFVHNKVMDEMKNNFTGDVLLEFQSHTDAITVAKKLDGVTTHIAAEGGKIKVVMGIGYEPNIIKKSIITDTDLRLLALKRKLQIAITNNEKNPDKKTRFDLSPTPIPKNQSVQSISAPTKCILISNERTYTDYGLSEEFMLKHKLKVPFSRTVIVSDFRAAVNEAKLMEVFSLAGEIKKIELYNRRNVYAKIEYDHPLEAVQAISMFNGIKLYKRKLIVQMDVLPQTKHLPEGLSWIGQGLGNNGDPLRGVRIEAEMRRIYELLVDLDKMERLNAEDLSPFKFTYKRLIPQLDKEIPAREPVPSFKDSSQEKTSTNNETTKRSEFPPIYYIMPSSKTADNSADKPSENSSKPDNSSKSLKNDSENSAVPESTLLAIQALGTVLIAQGLIPPQTDCKSLQSILTALQKKTVPNQNLLISLPDQSNSNSKIDKTASNKPNRTPDANISAAVPNPGISNLIPNQIEALYKTINNMMQFMPPNPVNIIPVQPNVRNVAPNTGNLTAPNLNQPVPIPAISGPAVGNPTPQPLNPSLLRNPSLLPTSRWPLHPRILHNVPPPPFCNQNVPPPPVCNQNVPPPPVCNQNVPPPPVCNQNVPPPPVCNQNVLPPPVCNQNVPPPPVCNQNVPPPLVCNQNLPPPPVCNQNLPPPPVCNLLTPQLLNQNRAMYDPIRTWREVPTQPILPQQIPPIQVQPIQPQSQNNEEIKSGMLMFKNLPPSVTAASLASKMGEIGELKFCELTGGGRGIICYKDANDADRCICLFHRSKVDDQVIDVGFL